MWACWHPSRSAHPCPPQSLKPSRALLARSEHATTPISTQSVYGGTSSASVGELCMLATPFGEHVSRRAV
eukprot:2993642-Amphidinium_carterae.1